MDNKILQGFLNPWRIGNQLVIDFQLCFWQNTEWVHLTPPYPKIVAKSRHVASFCGASAVTVTGVFKVG